MRKFKHKQTGAVAISIEYGERYTGIQYYRIDNDMNSSVPEDIIISNDWQELTKPEYTILTWKLNDIVIHFTGHPDARIHSVRRESDGEVFTVGDRVFDKWNIGSFELEGGGINVYTPDGHAGNNLENLKKVKPKEWEITAFDKNGEIYPNEESKNYLLRGDYEIYSIKRLSDNIEFKIGDRVECKNNPVQTINNLYLNTEGNVLFEGTSAMLLEYWKKAKHPLFTTEDGVDIYENDTYYWVAEESNSSSLEPFILREHSETKGVSIVFDMENKVHNFSTQKAALNYIKCNKPCLSLNEILNCVYPSDKERIKLQLTKLVKKKLNEKS